MKGILNTMHPIQGLQFHTQFFGEVLDLSFHISGANSEVVQTFYFVHDLFLRLPVLLKIKPLCQHLRNSGFIKSRT